MSWTSDNADVGNGSQTITKYEPPNFVEARARFRHARQAGRHASTLCLRPSGTNVTWTFKSDLEGIPAKWFGLMFDRWIGADYEKGLAKLKAVAETRSRTNRAGTACASATLA